MASQIIKIKNRDSQVSVGTLRSLLLLVGLVALLGLIFLGQNGQATLTGHRAQDLQTQLQRIQRENAQLEFEIAQLSMPSRIADRARALGFRPATLSQTVFVVVKNYPTESKPVAATTAPTPAPSNDLTMLWNNLLSFVGLTPAGNTVEATGP